MTAGQRVLWGSLVGALLVLLVHPSSQPYFTLFLRHLGPSKTLTNSPLIQRNVSTVSTPRTRDDAAFLLLMVAKQSTGLRKLSESESQYAADLARQCSEADPTNGFWRQVAAVYDKVGQHQDWEQASQATRWDDRQSIRLSKLNQALKTEYGYTMPWHSAALLGERSSAPARAILRHVQVQKAASSATVDERLATLRNGQLLMEGGRSIEIGALGARVLQLAARGPNQVDSSSIAESLRRRQSFLDEIRAQKSIEEARAAEIAFSNADSWSNVVDTSGNRQDRYERMFWSVVAASLPGCFVYVALFGAVLIAAGWLVSHYRYSHPIFTYPIAPILGLGIGTAIYASTRLVWPSLWAVLSLAFFVFQPAAVRSRPPQGLGGNHRMVVVFVGLMTALCFGLFIAGLGAPLRALGAELGLPAEYRAGSSLLLGLTLFCLSIGVFSAPIWALIHRHEPLALLKIVLYELGRGMVTTGLAASIVSTPICIFINRSLDEPLTKTLLNEPNLYLTE